jgi:hypothetical protein
MWLRIQIRQDPERAAFPQHSQGLSGGALFVDCPVAKSCSNILDHRFDPGIIDRSQQAISVVDQDPKLWIC